MRKPIVRGKRASATALPSTESVAVPPARRVVELAHLLDRVHHASDLVVAVGENPLLVGAQ
jgi:hypothetical protein